MIKIYTAPISNTTHKTLQAKGSDWESLYVLLGEQQKTFLQEQLFMAFPQAFDRNLHLRLTFTNKIANQLLTVAGVSS